MTPARHPDLCPTCRLIHPPMTPCVDAQAAAMTDLLGKVGRIHTCRCGVPTFWVTAIGGKTIQYNRGGLDHSRTCKAIAMHPFHEPMPDTVEAWNAAMADVLLRVGGIDQCDCGLPIF